MKTIVAVTSQNKKQVTEHAGRCRNFWVYTIDKDKVIAKKLLSVSKEETLHEVFHGANGLHAKNVLCDADILLTKGIGRGASYKLANMNVASYVITETDPDIAVDKLIKGVLEAITPISHDKGCSCNGQDHHHHEEH